MTDTDREWGELRERLLMLRDSLGSKNKVADDFRAAFDDAAAALSTATERLDEERDSHQTLLRHATECQRARAAAFDERDVAKARAHAAEAERERLARALARLCEAAEPYRDKAAPHEDLWNAEDYRAFNELVEALNRARQALEEESK